MIHGHPGVQPEEHPEGTGDDHHLPPLHLPDLTPEKDETAQHVVLHLHVPKVVQLRHHPVFLFIRYPAVNLKCMHNLNSSA